MVVKKFFFTAGLVFVIAFLLTAGLTYVYSWIFHGAGAFDWAVSIRLGIILAIVLGFQAVRGERRRSQS